MTTVPYSSTPQYTTQIFDDDIFVIEQHSSGFDGMRKISVKDFLKPINDKIATALTSLYKFMGNVNTYEDLPEYIGPQEPIPVWGILSGAEAGKNFAWVTDHWEDFGFKVDLSNYVTKEDLEVSLAEYALSEHTHEQSEIRNLNVVQSLTLVRESEEDGGENIFSVQKTSGTSQLFAIKNGKKGTDSISYRISGMGSITQNIDGSYSPEFLYLQSQKLTDTIEAYPGRILIASEINDSWVTLYPNPTNSWEDTSFLQYYIPAGTTNLRVRLYKSGTDYSEIDDNLLLYEEHVSIAQPGLRGLSSKSVEIEATSYIFKTDSSGIIVSPQTIDFTAKLQNTSGGLSWIATNGSTTIATGSNPIFTITQTMMAPYDSITINLICDGISDTCTIIKIADGENGIDAINIINSNESFTIPTNYDGITSSIFSNEVTFTGFKGIDEVNCLITNISSLPSGMSAATNKNKVIFSIPTSTPITSDFGSIDVEIYCEGVTFVKTVSWSISKQGIPSQSISIEAGSYIFKADTAGVIKSPQEIEFVATRQNITSVPLWTATNGDTVVKTGNGTSFKISAEEMGSYSSLKIKVACEGYTDSCSIFVVSDGLSGFSTAQVRLCKRANSKPNNFNGGNATYTFATNALEFDSGGDDGWSQTIPSTSGDLYVIYASAHSQNPTDEIKPNEWTEPAILSEESVAGQNGYNVATVLIFCRSKSQPNTPASNVTYTFENGTITGLDGSWEKYVPNGSDDLWVSQATAFSQTISDVISPSEWSTPTVMSSNGQSYNTAQLLLYKRGYELPTNYDGGVVTYNFTNAQFSFGIGGNDGWYPTPQEASGNIYVICASISSQTNTAIVNKNEWTTPQIYAPEPSNGIDGYNSSTVFIYTRSETKPQVPQNSITYVFETGSITGLSSSWSENIPTGTEDIWITQATAFSNSSTVTIESSKWADPKILASNGMSGSNGYSSAQVLLYKRGDSVPSNYDGSTVKYKFSTGEITFIGEQDGWSVEPPSGTQNLYVIRASAASQSDEDTIGSNEWSSPKLYSAKAENGADGLNGYNVATVYIYKRSANVPSTPSQDSVYTFETGEVSNLSDGWNYTITNGTEPLWVTQATAFSRSTTDTIESTQWAVPPTVMARDGTNGIDAISIACTNESFGVPTDASGKTINAFNTEISFLGYLGTTAKLVTLSSISNVPEGMTVTANGNVLTVYIQQNVNLSQDYGTINLIVSCDTVNVSKSIYWIKNKQGAAGSPGEKGKNGSIWYQGTILNGTGTASGVAGNEGDFYLNNASCNVYQCIVSGDNETALWKYRSNIKGDTGKSFTINISSSNGSVFRREDINTILYCHVYLNNEEITDVLGDHLFNWKRVTGNEIEDERWNTSSKAIAHKSVWITPSDCIGRTVFTCEVDLSEFE